MASESINPSIRKSSALRILSPDSRFLISFLLSLVREDSFDGQIARRLVVTSRREQSYACMYVLCIDGREGFNTNTGLGIVHSTST